MLDYVCGICGGEVVPGSVRASVDPRYPLGLCKSCRKAPLPPGADATDEQKRAYASAVAKRPIRQALSPLVDRQDFRARKRRSDQATPLDLFDGFEPRVFAARDTRL